MKSKRIINQGWSLLVCMVLGCVAAASESSNAQPSKESKIREMYERMKPVRIDGKVVDLEGHPVQGAEVVVSWEQMVLLGGKIELRPHVSTVFSENTGRWTYSFDKPWRAYVSDVRKEGYYSYKDLNSGSARNVIEQRTTPEQPVEIELRKKGELTFLVCREGSRPIRAIAPHSHTNNLDLIEEYPDKLTNKCYTDIRVALTWSSSSNKWAVTYSAPIGADGLIVGTNFLYEAPHDGYLKEVVISDPPWPKYVYLKSRLPPIYSRLHLEYDLWKGGDTNQDFGISYMAWVNPFGERNLEYDQSVKQNWRVEKELKEEAKTAIQAGRWLSKPDIPQRIKAMNDRVAKDKAERERRQPPPVRVGRGGAAHGRHQRRRLAGRAAEVRVLSGRPPRHKDGSEPHQRGVDNVAQPPVRVGRLEACKPEVIGVVI